MDQLLKILLIMSLWAVLLDAWIAGCPSHSKRLCQEICDLQKDPNFIQTEAHWNEKEICLQCFLVHCNDFKIWGHTHYWPPATVPNRKMP